MSCKINQTADGFCSGLFMSVLLLHHQLHYEQCTVQMSFSHNSLVLIQMIIRHLMSHKSVCLDNDESDITAELKLFHHLRV